MGAGQSSAHFGKGSASPGCSESSLGHLARAGSTLLQQGDSCQPRGLALVQQFLSCLAPALWGAHAGHSPPCARVSPQTAWPGRGPWRMRRSSSESGGDGTATCCRQHPRMRSPPALPRTPAQPPAGLWGPAGTAPAPGTEPWQLCWVGMAPVPQPTAPGRRDGLPRRAQVGWLRWAPHGTGVLGQGWGRAELGWAPHGTGLAWCWCPGMRLQKCFISMSKRKKKRIFFQTFPQTAELG